MGAERHYNSKIKSWESKGKKAKKCPHSKITKYKTCWNITTQGEKACKTCSALKKMSKRDKSVKNPLFFYFL